MAKQVYRWLQIYNFRDNVESYLKDLTRLAIRPQLERWKIRIHFLLIILQTLHMLYLLDAPPLDDFVRVLHFDYSFFLDCSPNVNCFPLVACIITLFTLYIMYFFDFQFGHHKDSQYMDKLMRQLSPLFLVQKVYYLKDNSTFLQYHDPATKLPVHRIIFNESRRFLIMGQYLSYVAALLHASCGIFLLQFILNNWDYFLATFPTGWLSLLLIHLNQWHFILLVNSGISLHMAFYLLNYIFTRIVFMRFRQANAILGPNFKLAKLEQFTSYHTETLKLVEINNRPFGSNIFAYVCTGIFVNSYFLQMTVTGQFNALSSLLFSHFVLFQWVIMLGFHFLASLYGKKIHSCCKLLLNHSAQLANRRNNPGKSVKKKSRSKRRSFLRLDEYIAKFHTVKSYGINYGRLGLITLPSFLKFLVIYNKLFIFWFKLHR